MVEQRLFPETVTEDSQTMPTEVIHIHCIFCFQDCKTCGFAKTLPSGFYGCQKKEALLL